MHRIVDERSKYLYTPPTSSLNTPMNRSRESSISRDQVSTSSKTAKNHVTFDNSSKSDVYSRNRVTRYTPEPERSFVMYVHGSESKKPQTTSYGRSTISSTTSMAKSANTDSPFQRRPYQAPSTYQYYSQSSKPTESTYLVRRANSLGEIHDSNSRKTEIFPAKSSPTPPLRETRYEKAVNSNSSNQQFYTDKYFSKTFLSESIPLSQMIVNKK